MKKILFVVFSIFFPLIVDASEYDEKKIIINGLDSGIVATTSTNDFVIIGNDVESCSKVIKYDYNGNLLWERDWDINGILYFDSLVIDKNDDIYIIGDIVFYDGEYRGTDSNGIILKYDKNGTLLWEKYLIGNSSDSFDSVMIGEKDEIIVYGYTNSTDLEYFENDGEYSFIVIEYDSNGNIILFENDDYIKNDSSSENLSYSDYINDPNINLVDFLELDDGIIIFENLTESDVELSPISLSYKISKINNNGKVLWEKIVDLEKYSLELRAFLTNDDGFLTAMKVVNDNENIFESGLSVILSKYNRNGELVSQDVINNSSSLVSNVAFVDNNLHEIFLTYGYVDESDNDGFVISKVAENNYDYVNVDDNFTILYIILVILILIDIILLIIYLKSKYKNKIK